MINGIYAKDLVWIGVAFVLFFLLLAVYFSKSLSSLENYSQGGNVEILKERRRKKSWREGIIALFFGYCQVCEKKRGSFVADGKRKQDGLIMLCEECSGNFSGVIEHKETSPTNNAEMF